MSFVRNEEKTLKIGEMLSACFLENATAGYLWEASEKTGTLNFNKITTAREFRDAEGNLAIGTFPQVEFVTAAQASGTYEIEFIHKRPWNNEVMEAVHYKLKIQP